MHISWILAAVLGLFFAALGAAKIRAVPAMRHRAHELGFSEDQYRIIGALELAGAAGLAVGLAVPVLGCLAAAGLLLLLAGALATHLRRHQGVREAAPAIAAGVLVALYLGVIVAAA